MTAAGKDLKEFPAFYFHLKLQILLVADHSSELLTGALTAISGMILRNFFHLYKIIPNIPLLYSGTFNQSLKVCNMYLNDSKACLRSSW